MGWQKTFALGRRPKGCHLVTEEVLSHIRPGLENVKVRQLGARELYSDYLHSQRS